MIQIHDKSKCCGCSACEQICPRKCISFYFDDEGFMYPCVATSECIDCGLCESVCPFYYQPKARDPLNTYAAKNNDNKERSESSSGGIFVLLAKKVISSGGVVFGARFDENWNVVHDYTETLDGIAPFMGSKYVQSYMGDSFSYVKKFLLEGREVLFSGTPCQIAGLKRFLHKEYDNLLLVDFICHGIPSPGVWIQYLEEIKEKARRGEVFNNNSYKSEEEKNDKKNHVKIESVSFRDKREGWKKYHLTITVSDTTAEGKNTISLTHTHSDDPYFVGFNNFNLFLRQTCYTCPFKQLRSGSDITLADFWGIETLLPEEDDDKGISVILVNTPKGQDYVNFLHITKRDVLYSDVIKRNVSVIHSHLAKPRSLVDIMRYHKVFSTKREYFFHDKKHTITNKVSFLGRPRLRDRCISVIKRIVNFMKTKRQQ